MVDNVALNEVVRVLGTELGKNDERILIGSTDEEKEVLQRHATKGKQRGVLGFVGGSTVCAGFWKALGGQRRLLGGFTMASGGMAGFMYGILSIRRGLFEEILTLPSDKSPFATRARQILDEQLPNNAFYLEVKEIFRKQEDANGSWDSTPSFPPIKSPKGGEAVISMGFKGLGGAPSTSPRMPRLPRTDASFKDDDNFSDDATSSSSSSSSPLFFGGSPSSENARPSTPATSHDYYGSPSPVSKKKDDDDDAYYNDDGWGLDSEKDKKTKPVTWEELRRRAASGNQ